MNSSQDALAQVEIERLRNRKLELESEIPDGRLLADSKTFIDAKIEGIVWCRRNL